MITRSQARVVAQIKPTARRYDRDVAGKTDQGADPSRHGSGTMTANKAARVIRADETTLVIRSLIQRRLINRRRNTKIRFA
jgi:hypothetical protein